MDVNITDIERDDQGPVLSSCGQNRRTSSENDHGVKIYSYKALMTSVWPLASPLTSKISSRL